MSDDVRRQVSILIGRGPNRHHRPAPGAVDQRGTGIELPPPGRWNLAIEGVIDPGPLGSRRYIEAEPLVVEASLKIEDRILDERNPHLRIGVLFAGARLEKIADLPSGSDPIRVVRPLRRHGLVAVNNGARRLRAAEVEPLASGAETEIGVQLFARIPPILARCEYHQVAARLDRHIGQDPLSQVPVIIAQRPAAEAHRARAFVVKLDPVGAISILIAQSGTVGGKQLTDHDGIERRVRVQPAAPDASLEEIRRFCPVGDSRVGAPGKDHLSNLRLLKGKNVGAGIGTSNARGGGAVHQ